MGLLASLLVGCFVAWLFGFNYLVASRLVGWLIAAWAVVGCWVLLVDLA